MVSAPMLAGAAAVYAQPMEFSPAPDLPQALAADDVLRPDWPAPAQVRALCTTRHGGVSKPPFDRLNLGAWVGDAPLDLAHNVGLLTATLGARPVFLRQVHGWALQELDAQTGQHQEADGSFTGQTGLACTVGAADCLPILLCHVSGGRATQVGALHAGWRGLAGEAGLGVVEVFFASPAAYGRPPDQWLAWLGPCIGPQAFEVGPEVRAAFLHAGAQAASAFQAAAGGKYLANLPDLARQRLAACGVRHIYGNDARPAWCTVGNPLRFFSYRRERVTGRQVAAIALV